MRLVLVFCFLSAATVTVAAPACYKTNEIFADVLMTFINTQALAAFRCDQFTEGLDRPKKLTFFEAHRRVRQKHDDELKGYLAWIDEFAQRNKISSKAYVQERNKQAVAYVKSININKVYCDLFYSELRKRESSFALIRQTVLAELMLHKERYQECR